LRRTKAAANDGHDGKPTGYAFTSMIIGILREQEAGVATGMCAATQKDISTKTYARRQARYS
jgi:hypothetical protein